MAEWKITYFFSFGKQGWSETYYTSAAESGPAIDNARELATLRVGLLAQNVAFEAIRVSDDAVQGDADLDEAPLLAANKLGGNADADPPFFAQLVRCQSGLAYRRQLYIRGIPDEVNNPQGEAGLNIFERWKANLKRFLLRLKGGKFNIKALGKGAAAPRANVIRVQSQALVDTDLTLSAALAGVNVGDNIRTYNIGGLVGANQSTDVSVNGVWRVTAINPGNVYRINFSQGGASNWNNKGTAKRINYIYTPINEAREQRLTHRDTGRPFGASVGRRPARR